MKTLLEIVQLSAEYLKQKGIANPRRQAEDLISDALNIERLQLYLQFDRPLTSPELEICRTYIDRRGKGEPSQYIHGEMKFYDCRIKVSSAVLIPRQETEILVDKICQTLSGQELNGKTLWDMCCGSGCIGIAIKKKFPTLSVHLSDISAAALTIAQENASRNHVNIICHEGDLFSAFPQEKTDFFICNPPYIRNEEYETLDSEVRKFEPKQALIAGSTGLEFYQKIAADLDRHLSPKGKAWLEIGTGQGKSISKLFHNPIWKENRIELDWAGHERFFFLEKE